jgi:CheY-like chemotaxis protein
MAWASGRRDGGVMNHSAHNPHTCSGGDAGSRWLDTREDRLLSWTFYGVNPAWVRLRLESACNQYREYLHQAESPDALPDGAGETDWDILFLGGEAEANIGTLEAAVRRVSHAHALNCVVAVSASPSPERLLGLLRAGAVDVIALDDSPDAIERAMDRTISLIQARRTQCEQEKLNLLSQLAVSVNHEINNPLAGLMGTAELLLLDNQANLTEKGRKDLKTIVEQCQRIREVTARLKELNHLRTVPYGAHDRMIDLIGELQPHGAMPERSIEADQFLPMPSILVVDDNPLIIDLIQRLLEGRFIVHSASCASDALSIVEKREHDLVLIDLILPEMNGLELFRAIRRIRPTQKSLLTTAYHGDARVEQALAEGALNCIYKPFQLDELDTVLADALKATGV